MSLCTLTNTYTHAYSVAKIDYLSWYCFLSTRGFSMAYAHCVDRREGTVRPEHKHALYKSTDAGFSYF